MAAQLPSGARQLTCHRRAFCDDLYSLVHLGRVTLTRTELPPGQFRGLSLVIFSESH